jgi:hypothetical protein
VSQRLRCGTHLNILSAGAGLQAAAQDAAPHLDVSRGGIDVGQRQRSLEGLQRAAAAYPRASVRARKCWGGGGLGTRRQPASKEGYRAADRGLRGAGSLSSHAPSQKFPAATAQAGQ